MNNLEFAVRPAVRQKITPWNYPRAIVGALLIVFSVALGIIVVGGSNQTKVYFVPRSTLSVGQIVDREDLKKVTLTPKETLGKYLAADFEFKENIQVNRVISEGELIPLSALSAEGVENYAIVPMTISSNLPKWVEEGQMVEVWAGETASFNSAAAPAPKLLASQATLVELKERTSFNSQGFKVQLQVQRDDLTLVLQSIMNGEEIVLLPQPGLDS